MDRLFVDTDVIIDLLDQRDPFYLPAAYLFSKADKKELKVIISSLSFTSIHYVLRKNMTNLESRKVLAKMKTFTQVGSVDEKIIDLALVSAFSDFEDAVQYYTALENMASVIITRNLRDYKKSAIPVMSAEGYLRSLI